MGGEPEKDGPRVLYIRLRFLDLSRASKIRGLLVSGWEWTMEGLGVEAIYNDRTGWRAWARMRSY